MTEARVRAPSTALLAALTGLTALSIDMSLPAMPQLQRAFHAGVASVQLTLSLFLLGYAAGQLTCGPLSDRWGRRPVLLAGLTVFTVAGLACAGSISLPMLVVCRFVQGMAASVGPILARAMVRDRFDHSHAAAVLSQITQVMVLAPVLAPTLGGGLLGWSGWPAIFLVLGGTGALLLALCVRGLPETLRERRPEAGQWRGVAAGFRAVLTHGPSLRHTLTVCFSYAGMFAYISGSPFVVMDVFGVSRPVFGLCFALTAVALMVGATVNRVLLPRLGSAALLARGVALVLAAGLILLTLDRLHWGGLAGVLGPMVAYLFGLGLVQPNATAAAMAPHGRAAGLASSVIGGLQTAGGAVAGACVAAFFRHTPDSLTATVALMAVLAALAHGRTPADARPSRTSRRRTRP